MKLLPFVEAQLGILFVSAVAAWAITFGVRFLALRFGVIAKRNARRRHDRDTPLLGGTAFYLIFCVLTLYLYLSGASIAGQELSGKSVLCFLAAITLIYGVGVWDDFRELRAPPKIAAQVLAAALILASEPDLPSVVRQTFLPDWLAAIVLILWIVGITNAMNMIDGLDGLCAGIGAISAFTVAAVVLSTGAQPDFWAYLVISLGGACIGFLFHNFNPARIFLGDSGSLVIGFVLAVVSVKVEVKRSLFVSLSIPILMLGLPLLDITLSVIRRRRLARSVFHGDRSHIHHRLQQVGLNHRAAVLLLWVCAGYLNLSAYFLAQVPASQSIYIYTSLVPTLAFWLFSLYFLERRLSYQAAKFSHFFLKSEDAALRDRTRLVQYLRERIRSSRPFYVVVLDCSHFIKEITHERPHRVVGFYMNLYGILRSRLRDSDLIARISDHIFVCVLADAPSEGEDGVVEYLRSQVRSLQESYHVFQSNPDRPEGFRCYSYPENKQRIWVALGIEPSELEPESLKKAA